MHNLIFNWREFLSQLEKRLRNYSSLKCTSPLFQGTISNWAVVSKVISWTGVGYSFIISTSIKQVKDLELILSVPFAFWSCCCEPTSCDQRSSPCIVHLYYEAPPNQLCCIWLNLSREYITIHFRILPLLLSSVTSSINTSNPAPLEAMHAHAITLLHRVLQMMLYALDHELFQAFCILFSSRHSGTGRSEVVWLF